MLNERKRKKSDVIIQHTHSLVYLRSTYARLLFFVLLRKKQDFLKEKCKKMSTKGQEDITEDDIQVGGTADVKWRKNGQSATYPAKLEKSRRTKAGVIEYK